MPRRPSTELTLRQRRLLDWIEAFAVREGMPPTVREIGHAFRITPRAVFDHLQALERKGCLKRGNLGARSLQLSSAQREGCAQCRSVPVLGRIAAGQPIFAVQEQEPLGAVRIEQAWLKGRE